MQKSSETKAWPLTIFLIKEEVAKPEGVLDNPGKLTQHKVSLGKTPALLYTKRSDLHLPGWAQFLTPIINVDGLGLKVRSSSALLLVVVKKRIFAIAFGYARHFLRAGTYEERFGLYVTLNSVDENKILAVDRDSLDVVGRHTKEQLSRESDLTEFGVDIEKDLLRAVSGVPADESLARRLTGSDALSIQAEVTAKSLPQLLARLLQISKLRQYRENFSWVDHINAVRDRQLQLLLDDRLVTRLRGGDLSRTWLAVPDVISWDEVKEFRYKDGPNAAGFPDVHFTAYFSERRAPEELTLAYLKRDKILCIRASDDVPFLSWPVYRCVYAELDEANSKYVLNAAQWYRVGTTFVAEIESEVSRIAASDLGLPPYEHESEAHYNKDVATRDPGTYTLCDAKSIRHGGGGSKIEFCDLFSKNKQLVHVKRYGGSGVLSHLFNQGLVAGELTVSDAAFRAKVNPQLPLALRFKPPEARPNPADYEIVYGIVSTSTKPVELPFFSKVILRSTHRTLTNMGLRVSVSQIPNKLKR
jgi:uncharacterized protein (TIGR04141 family)